jgi:hypothetical protein
MMDPQIIGVAFTGTKMDLIEQASVLDSGRISMAHKAMYEAKFCRFLTVTEASQV